MKIKTILIAAMLAVSGLTQAQVSKDAFEKAVDFINCKSVELSLKKSPTTGVTKQFQANCICQDNPDFNTIKSAIPASETKTIELSSEIDKVKSNQFKSTLTSDDVIKLLTEDIFVSQSRYQKLYDFASKRKDDAAFASYVAELKSDLPAILATQTQASNTSQPNSDSQDQVKPPSLEERVSALEQSKTPPVEEKGWFSRNINIFVIISLILAILLAIIKVIQVVNGGSTGGEEVSDGVRKYVKDKINDAGFNRGNSNQGVSSFTISNLEDKIKKLETELKDVKSKVDSSKIPFEVVQPRYEQQSWQETKQPEVKSETFFLSTPNSDGSFNDSSVSPTYKEGASIYKFTKVGNNRAKFQIDEREASVKLALTYPDKSIDPVCDAVNAFNPKAKRITTVDVGEAELLNDKWIVNKSQKAKIRYES
jgi:hypothetical protein